MKKYEITYHYSSTRKMTVKANSKEEAELKFENGEYIEDIEDDCDDGIIQEIKEV